MTRIGRDSVTPADVPVSGTQVIIGYADGKYDWTSGDFARFAPAATCLVDVNGSDPHADMLDVEKEDASVATAVTWTREKLALKGPYLPIIYCNRSTLTPLFNAMNAAGFFIGKHFLIGIATLDGKTKSVPDMTGVWGVQWKPASASSGAGHYDEWIIYDDAWKPPAKPVTPPPVKVQDAVLVQIPTGITKPVHSTDGVHWS